jgi:histidyl-tRNA synthetase
LIREAFEADDHTCSLEQALELLDKRYSMEHDLAERRAKEMGFRLGEFDVRLASISEAAIRVDSKQLRHSSGAAHRLLEVMAEVEHLHIRDRCYPDPKIVRGLAYYTRTVFEIIRDDERAIAGGGRYDNLLKVVSGTDLPALGLGMGDVVLRELLVDRGLLPTAARGIDYFVVTVEEGQRPEALQIVHRLRDAGHSVEYGLRHQGVGKQLKAASSLNARHAIILGPDELAAGEVVVRAMEGGTEMRATIERLLASDVL